MDQEVEIKDVQNLADLMLMDGESEEKILSEIKKQFGVTVTMDPSGIVTIDG